jgi:hypothetical protein
MVGDALTVMLPVGCGPSAAVNLYPQEGQFGEAERECAIVVALNMQGSDAEEQLNLTTAPAPCLASGSASTGQSEVVL